MYGTSTIVHQTAIVIDAVECNIASQLGCKLTGTNYGALSPPYGQLAGCVGQASTNLQGKCSGNSSCSYAQTTGIGECGSPVSAECHPR